jgi:hypothetical protein
MRQPPSNWCGCSAPSRGMGDQGSLENDERVLAVSRIVDQVADEFLGDDPDWRPLETVLPLEWCDGFMWMYRVEQDEANIELYKHGITRRYLNLDQDNKAYRFTGTDYIQIPVGEAIDRVFAGIEDLRLPHVRRRSAGTPRPLRRSTPSAQGSCRLPDRHPKHRRRHSPRTAIPGRLGPPRRLQRRPRSGEILAGDQNGPVSRSPVSIGLANRTKYRHQFPTSDVQSVGVDRESRAGLRPPDLGLRSV